MSDNKLILFLLFNITESDTDTRAVRTPKKCPIYVSFIVFKVN